MWAELDSNQRSETQRIYNPLPLTTRAPTLINFSITRLLKKYNSLFFFVIIYIKVKIFLRNIS
jgi:hypothetical protein